MKSVPATTPHQPAHPSPYCHTDEHGAPDAACWDMAMGQWTRGYMQGYTDGARRVEHDVDQSVRRIMQDIRDQTLGGPA